MFMLKDRNALAARSRRTLWTIGGVGLTCLLLASCGSKPTMSSAGAGANANVSATTIRVESTVIGSTTSPTTAASPDTIATPEGQVSLGPMSFVLPDNAAQDPRPPSGLPDFVEEYERWLVPGEGILIVNLQKETPPFPDAQRIQSVQSNGLNWDLYNVGPGDGSQVSAIAQTGSGAIIVTAQGWTPEERTRPREFVNTVVQSLSIQEG